MSRFGRSIAGLAGPAMLLAAAVIWAAGFLAQQLGMNHVGPWTFGVVRNLLAVVFLAPAAIIAIRKKGKGAFDCRRYAVGSVACGTALFSASMTQQVGLQWTTAGMAGFLTANYVLLVPVIGAAFGRKAPCGIYFSVFLALSGLYFISIGSDSAISVGKGEAFEIACAVLFAVHILCIDRFAADLDPVALSCGQFSVCFFEGLPFLALPSESARLCFEAVEAALPAIAFAGILSSGVAFTLQTVAQTRTPPALASLVMSLESVFAAVFGWVFLHQTMTARQILGCVLVFCAVASAPFLAALSPDVLKRFGAAGRFFATRSAFRFGKAQKN